MTLRDLLLAVLKEDADLDAKVVFESKVNEDDVEEATSVDDEGETVDKGVILPNSPVIVSNVSVNEEGEIVFSND